jgi:hypothetical protein
VKEGRKSDGWGAGRTPKRNHVNLPASPSDGVSANDALGSSRHTCSRGISISRDFINARTPCLWHSACACTWAESESEMLVSEKAAEREALVALERFVKAMDAVGPASVRMCYVVQYVCMKYYIITFETGECSLAAHLVLEFHPTGKCVGRRVILFHMFCERKQIVLIFVGSFAFFFLLLTDDIREHHLYPVIDCWW